MQGEGEARRAAPRFASGRCSSGVRACPCCTGYARAGLAVLGGQEGGSKWRGRGWISASVQPVTSPWVGVGSRARSRGKLSQAICPAAGRAPLHLGASGACAPPAVLHSAAEVPCVRLASRGEAQAVPGWESTLALACGAPGCRSHPHGRAGTPWLGLCHWAEPREIELGPGRVLGSPLLRGSGLVAAEI